MSTLSWRPVSGSTRRSVPTLGSASSRGSRISTATTSWRPASASSGRRQSRGPRKSEITATNARWRAIAPVRPSAAPREVAPSRRAGPVSVKGEQKPDQCCSALAGRDGARLAVAERQHAEPVAVAARDVAERERRALCDVRLASLGRSELHRHRRVEHDPADEHALGQLDADVRLPCPRGDVPVDVTDVVLAGDVRTYLGELGPSSRARAPGGRPRAVPRRAVRR